MGAVQAEATLCERRYMALLSRGEGSQSRAAGGHPHRRSLLKRAEVEAQPDAEPFTMVWRRKSRKRVSGGGAGRGGWCHERVGSRVGVSVCREGGGGHLDRPGRGGLDERTVWLV